MSRPGLFLLILLSTLVTGCAQTAQAPAEEPLTARPSRSLIYLPNTTLPAPSSNRVIPRRNKAELAEQIEALNPNVGGYPPKLRSELHRAQIHETWLDLYEDTTAYQMTEGWSESTYFFLSELHRQGHNMKVKGSGAKAIETVEACLAEFPESKPCHFSAAYLYLSIDPTLLHRAERSLTFLRAALAPEIDSEVERGFVHLYLRQRRLPEAVEQIDQFLIAFPDSPNRRKLEFFRKAVLEGIIDEKGLVLN